MPLYANTHVSDRYYQRGEGLGSIFSWIWRGLKPVGKALLKTGVKAATSKPAKRLAKQAVKELKKTGLNAVASAVAGEDVSAQIKKDFKKARKAAGRKLRYKRGDGSAQLGIFAA